MDLDEKEEEIQIKIEYYESEDVDPLNIYSETLNKTGSLINELISDDVVQISDSEDKNNDHFTNENYDKIRNNEETANINNNLCSEISDNELGENNEKNQIAPTWYKAIDYEGKYICKFCTSSYRNVQTVRRHALAKHTNEAKELKGKFLNYKRKSKMKCHICKNSFTELSNLKEHMRRAHNFNGSGSFCHICYANFDNHNQMSSHLSAEHKVFCEKLKMYICKTCGYYTGKVSHYKQHLKTHLDVKSIKCKSCDYATNYLPNLKIHERIHLNCKIYKCSFTGCEYSAVARTALRSHQMKHRRQVNLLFCDKCTYKTLYRQTLLRHIQTHSIR